MNRIRKLSEFGQSVWFDFIRRDLFTSGELKRLIDEDGLSGMTSNPSIFEKAIGGGDEYRAVLDAVACETGLDTKTLYERIAIDDIRMAASAMQPVYTRSARRDGYVSLEVSPHLAHETAGTVAEARRLWGEVGFENLMIKVPGTPEGIPAIEQLISEGINVNVTLLFSRDAYEQAAFAYIRGLERLAEAGGDLTKLASVASFFVSRIDTEVDGRLEERLKEAASEGERARIQGLLGKAAVANAKLAYERYKEIFAGPSWARLEVKGARPQRVLWASTSTKNPEYRDVLYIEELIGQETVSTIPPNAYEAFLDHGEVRTSLEEDLEGARRIMDALAELGISMEEVTSKLLVDGVRLFAEAFDKLLSTITQACMKESR
jgi:transaldolase/glucose-6-phosphate isomerase